MVCVIKKLLMSQGIEDEKKMTFEVR